MKFPIILLLNRKNWKYYTNISKYIYINFKFHNKLTAKTDIKLIFNL